MSNFNKMSSSSSENYDNPWAVDDSAERDSEKSLAERLPEAGVSDKILNSEYLKDTLKSDAQIKDFDVSADGKELTLRGDNEYYKNNQYGYESAVNRRTDRTISLLDNGGMVIGEESVATNAYQQYSPSGSRTSDVSLTGERTVSRSILDSDGNITHYEKTEIHNPGYKDYYNGGFVQEGLREVVTKAYLVNYTDRRREIRADIADGGYVNVKVAEWRSDVPTWGEQPHGSPTVEHLQYQRDSRDDKYNMRYTVGPDLDMQLNSLS